MSKTYGYCRISTQKQSIERQERNIRAEYPTAVIVKEAYTGTSISRPEFDKLLRKVKTGDTLVFDSVSRMSRNASEGFELYEKLFDNGIELVFLKEHHIDTATYRKSLESSIPTVGGAVELLLNGVRAFLKELAKEQIRLAFEQSEKEVLDLHQRTAEGIETARLNGKTIGHEKGTTWETAKAKEAKELIKKHSSAFGGALNDTEMMKLAGISRNSLKKYINELKGGEQ